MHAWNARHWPILVYILQLYCKTCLQTLAKGVGETIKRKPTPTVGPCVVFDVAKIPRNVFGSVCSGECFSLHECSNYTARMNTVYIYSSYVYTYIQPHVS